MRDTVKNGKGYVPTWEQVLADEADYQQELLRLRNYEHAANANWYSNATPKSHLNSALAGLRQMLARMKARIDSDRQFLMAA